MRARLAAYVLLAALVLLLPAVAGPFLRYLVLNMLLLALLALSFNLLFGMTGLLSFGQGAFYAGGAYTAALLLRAGIPILWSILLGALAAALLAAVLGAFCVRHTRIYFSMLTLAFGMLVYAVVWKWTSVTGGDDGLIGIPRGRIGLPGPLDVRLDEPVMATLIGGPLSFLGPIVGAVVYLGLKEIIVRFTEYWLLVFGLVLLGTVLAFRGGLLGAAGELLARRRRA